MKALIDTGATTSVIDLSLAKLLGLKRVGTVENNKSGVTEVQAAYRVGIRLHGAKNGFETDAASSELKNGNDFLFIIGWDIMRFFKMTFDTKARVVRFDPYNEGAPVPTHP